MAGARHVARGFFVGGGHLRFVDLLHIALLIEQHMLAQGADITLACDLVMVRLKEAVDVGQCRSIRAGQ